MPSVQRLLRPPLALRLALLAAPLALLGTAACAGEAKKPQRVRCEEVDYGAFFGGSFVLSAQPKYDNKTGIYAGSDCCAKGVVAILAPGMDDGAMFDIDTMRIAAAWTGAAPRLVGWWLNGKHGPTSNLGGAPLFLTRSGPGWASPAGSFADPRADTIAPLPPPGPLPRTWARYRGVYRHGRQSVFSYTVGSCAVLELLALEQGGGVAAISRTFELAPHDTALAVALGDADGDSPAAGAIVAAPAGAALDTVEGRLVLRLPPSAQPARVKVLVGAGASAAAIAALAKQSPAPVELAPLTKGGAPLWKEPLTTAGTRAADDAAYVVDSVALPTENPWKAMLKPSAFDFFPDGASAAVATLNGDVFIVSGLDDQLKTVTWRRFVAGLHCPLGLKIVDGVIHVACRDGIHRLHDLDTDGEADFVECFNTDLLQTPSFHTFVSDLNTDPQGNFYFGVGAAILAGGFDFQKLTPHLGTIQKLSKDGQKLETFATGCRMPNGGGVSPDGRVTTSDNQGVWVPATPIHWVKQGAFLGVCDTAYGAKTHPPQPICFLPQDVDSSACSQTWIADDRWGPFAGTFVHGSYGKASLHAVLLDRADAMQGGVVRIPAQFSSTSMRQRVCPRDGQLWVAGLRMSQSNGKAEGGFDRVRYTGKPVTLPVSYATTPTGLAITFACKLDAAKAADLGNWSAEAWNYNWTRGYGSPQVPVLDGGKSTAIAGKKGGGRSIFTVTAAKLGEDGRTVTLAIAEMRPVQNLKVAWKLAAADGAAMDGDLHCTVHALPAR